LVNSHYVITPCESYYERLEVDEFWTYVGNKDKKYWLTYAYEREGGEIVSYVCVSLKIVESFESF
jgi:hypothetical protein